MSTITDRIPSAAEIQQALFTLSRPPIMDFVTGTTDDGCPILSTDAPDVCENIL